MVKNRTWLFVSAVVLVAAPAALLPPAMMIAFQRPVVTWPVARGTYSGHACPSLWADWTNHGLKPLRGFEMVNDWYRPCIAERASAQLHVELLVGAAVVVGVLAGIGFLASVVRILLSREDVS